MFRPYNLYELLSWLWIFKAAKRGPSALIRQRLRAKTIKQAAKLARKVFPR